MYLLPQSDSLLLLNNASFSSLAGHKRSRSQLEATVSTTASTVESKKRRIVVIKKKTVRFAPAQQIIASTTSTSGEDSMWYSAQDYASFRQNMKRDVYYLASLCSTHTKRPMDRKEYSPLGLEKYCCSFADQQQTKWVKQQRIRCVLDQQTLQRLQGVTDVHTIQFMAQVLAQPAVLKALERGARVAPKH